MADHRADRAVVQRIVGLRIEERRLQDGGREHDLVLQRVVVGVDRLRRHAPLGLVGGLADLGEVVAIVEFPSLHHVLEIAVA
jgi:hypothetical protein